MVLQVLLSMFPLVQLNQHQEMNINHLWQNTIKSSRRLQENKRIASWQQKKNLHLIFESSFRQKIPFPLRIIMTATRNEATQEGGIILITTTT